jgi:predicted nuclease with TOPRIM domain
MENIKLTQEEIDQIKELQSQNQALAVELGNLEVTKIQIELHHKELVQFYSELKSKEQELGKALSEKYGSGTVDLDKGEFIPVQ